MLDLVRGARRWSAMAPAVALALLAAGAPARAAGKGGAPDCLARPIVVGFYEFGHLYRAGAGLDKDVADELARRSGCTFQARVMPRRLIWQGMQQGAVDMTLSAAATPARKAFAWAEPYLWMRNMILLNRAVPADVRSVADFIAAPNLRLGVGRGYAAGAGYEELVNQLRNIGRVEDVDEAERLYAMFKAGRFQALLSPQLVYATYLDADIASGAVRVADWGGGAAKAPAHLLLSKKHFSAEQARRWGGLLKAMTADGTMLRLVSQYIGKEEAERLLSPAP